MYGQSNFLRHNMAILGEKGYLHLFRMKKKLKEKYVNFFSQNAGVNSVAFFESRNSFNG